jgi:hypothetical protein
MKVYSPNFNSREGKLKIYMKKTKHIEVWLSHLRIPDSQIQIEVVQFSKHLRLW